MTNREIDALIAEKVMGWRIHPRNTAHYMHKDDDAIGYRVVAIAGDWLPSTDISAAWQVAERLEELFGCIVAVKILPNRAGINKVWNGERWEKKRYSVAVSGGDLAYDNMNLTSTTYDDLACMAICLAALKAAGVEL